jgi:catechol 2,3-dioxygenase-like lactoylglutathione lyase family enzyme
VITALDHVQLAAPPGVEDACRAYYGDTLGMTEIPKPAPIAARGGVWFQAGSAQLHIGSEAAFTTPARKAHPALRVTGIRAYAERIAARGAEVTWDGSIPGVLRFYSRDPFGNAIEFLEPLPDATSTD